MTNIPHSLLVNQLVIDFKSQLSRMTRDGPQAARIVKYDQTALPKIPFVCTVYLLVAMAMQSKA